LYKVLQNNNLDGDWQKELLFNLQSYGGERILTFQKEKLKEVAMKLTNPFWKDVLSSYYFLTPDYSTSKNHWYSVYF
jgi:hypothetical protein